MQLFRLGNFQPREMGDFSDDLLVNGHGNFALLKTLKQVIYHRL
jgi:hypothetical protein